MVRGIKDFVTLPQLKPQCMNQGEELAYYLPPQLKQEPALLGALATSVPHEVGHKQSSRHMFFYVHEQVFFSL